MEVQFDDALEVRELFPAKSYLPDKEEPFTSYPSPLDSLIYGDYKPDTWQKISNGLGRLKSPKQLAMSTLFKNYNDFQSYQKDIKMKQEFLKVDKWRVMLGKGKSLNLSYKPQGCMMLSTLYGHTREFLMSPTLYEGVPLDTLMRVYNNGSLYGPLTLEALQLMGHATRQNPIQLELSIPKNDTGFEKFFDNQDAKKLFYPRLSDCRFLKTDAASCGQVSESFVERRRKHPVPQFV